MNKPDCLFIFYCNFVNCFSQKSKLNSTKIVKYHVKSFNYCCRC